ncbi:hypothetical protein B0H10DRAFT_2219402 [Mycena sp. CBHHK59/15]|nr:hypothetical protein B0H10DRAFT_2219402 [Mycena sp. CBHHK59/15]
MSTSSATPPANSDPELAALVATLERLTHLASEAQAQLTKALLSRLLAARDTGPLFVRGVPITPNALEAAFPPTNPDAQVYYVVLIGRGPVVWRPIKPEVFPMHPRFLLVS